MQEQLKLASRPLIHIYIYIKRERERDSYGKRSLSLSATPSLQIQRERAGERERVRNMRRLTDWLTLAWLQDQLLKEIYHFIR